MHQRIKFILFWNGTVQVSDGLLASRQQYLINACCCMYSLELLIMDGKTVRTCRVSFQNKINLLL